MSLPSPPVDRTLQASLSSSLTAYHAFIQTILDQLAELGYSAALFPVTLFRVAMKAMEAAAALLAMEGTQTDLLDMMQTREELYDLLDYQGYEERDRQHFGR